MIAVLRFEGLCSRYRDLARASKCGRTWTRYQSHSVGRIKVATEGACSSSSPNGCSLHSFLCLILLFLRHFHTSLRVLTISPHTLQAIGLGSIPLIITPIDESVHRFADLTYKPILKKVFPVD